MIDNKLFQIEYAAKKLAQAGALFPIDKNDAAKDITAIVSNDILLTVVEIYDESPGTIITKRNLPDVLDDVVYDCSLYSKPTIALFDEDDQYLYYVVYDADPLSKW